MVSALELFESKPASHAADGEEIQHHLQKHLIYWGHTVQTVRTRRQTCIYIYCIQSIAIGQGKILSYSIFCSSTVSPGQVWF